MKQFITCPACGREYLPEEIFVRGDMYGNPKAIVRDEKGKIIGYSGTTAHFSETYICDGCGTNFRVSGCLSFKTDVAPVSSFDEEYVSKFERVSLSED